MQNRIFWDTKECNERELSFDKEREYREKERELSLDKELSFNKEKDKLGKCMDRLSRQKMTTPWTLTPEVVASHQTYDHSLLFEEIGHVSIGAKFAQTK
jgi:hypothetical protein